MRITYLELKNFANIYAATGQKSIKIDLSKCKNTIVILVGANGSGKTSILSELHPFASSGTMDVRNDTCLILEGKDGYKEIHIVDNDDKYIIKHFYNYSGSSKTMKSYISKNEIELNPNGNVTSFKEVVKLHLGLELELLRLMRLGSNVSNLIDMKASSRKSFATDLFGDIDVYTGFHKRVSEEYRVLRSLIKSTSEKISKLRIFDKTEVDTIVRTLNSRLDTYSNRRQLLIEENAVLNSKLDTYESLYKLSEIPSINQRIIKLNSNIKKIDKDINKISNLEVVILGSVEDNIDSIESDINHLSMQTTLNKHKVETSFKMLDMYTKQRDSKNKILESFMSDSRRKEIIDLLDELYLQVKDLDSKYENFTPKYTREDLIFLLSNLQNLSNIVQDLNMYSDTAVKEVIELLISGKSVTEVAVKHHDSISKEISDLKISLSKITDARNNNTFAIVYQPRGCEELSCPYIDYYNQTNKKVGGDADDLMKKIRALEINQEYYESYTDIQDVLYSIRRYIKLNEKYLNILDNNEYSFGNILNKIVTKKELYNEDKISDLISEMEEYDKYIKLKKDIDDMEKELNSSANSAEKIEIVKLDLSELNVNIFEIEKSIKDLNERISIDTDKIKELKTTRDDMKKLNLLYKEKYLLFDECSKLENELDYKKKKALDLSEIESRINVNKLELVNINHEISKINNELKDYTFRIKEFEELSNEKKFLEEKFEDISLLKEALSSNKGIPLLYLQLYLKNCTMTINQLLELVYDGSTHNGTLEVCDFIINDKEFKIPYIRNGVRVSDVIHSSQGEKSFISLIISLALIIQTIDKYNIMLLDEVDATLDTKNRESFIRILERMLAKTGAEQVFLISHNNMFDNYPVDVIQTSDVQLDNFKNINVVYKQ